MIISSARRLSSISSMNSTCPRHIALSERYGGHEILKGTHFSKYKQFVNNCFDTCPRQALHAMTLGFVHPVTGEEMYFTSELPDDMTRLIEKWRGYISNRELE